VEAGSTVPELERPPCRAMTRCECAEMPFAAIARLHREEGLSLDEIIHRTGCGQTCTACLPDLHAYLKSD
jgi:NAD(P)H-nitrite reductase large subunit